MSKCCIILSCGLQYGQRSKGNLQSLVIAFIAINCIIMVA